MSAERIVEILRDHRFDDSMPDEIFCHEAGDSPMVGLKRGANAQDDWEEWVEHIAPVLAQQLAALPEHFVISAVRYALPRQTYIVAETVDQVIRIWPTLSQNTRRVIARDVSHHLTYDPLPGTATDQQDWLRLMRHAETNP